MPFAAAVPRAEIDPIAIRDDLGVVAGDAVQHIASRLVLPDSPTGRLLAARRHVLMDALARYGARQVRVYGSVSRGEDTPASDVDLLVDLPDGTSLLGLTALRRELTEILGRQVDVVPARALRDEVLASAEQDAVFL